MLEEFWNKFAPQDFEEMSEPVRGGALIAKVNLDPNAVFELLEVLCGEYKDLNGDVLWIDSKSTWERCFKTKQGVLRIYDYKGSTSIGYGGELTDGLRSEAARIKKYLEDAFQEYKKIKPEILKKEIQENPLANFTRTFLAVSTLLKKAKLNGSSLESLVLLASTIDAQLRFGIILATQLNENTSTYDRSLVFQEGKEFISEREVHRIALRSNVIDQQAYEEISELYDFRNRAVHRYFISDLEYVEIKQILDRFEAVRALIGEKLSSLEKEQVEKGVGMTTRDHLEMNDATIKQILREQNMKIDSSPSVAIIPRRKRLFEDDSNSNLE